MSKIRCLLYHQSKTPDFCRTLIKPLGFPFFYALFIKTDASLSAHFESWHAVYSDYIPDTIKESPALLSVFLSVEIFGIDNHFQYAKGSFYLNRAVHPVLDPFFAQDVFIGLLTLFQKVLRKIQLLVSL